MTKARACKVVGQERKLGSERKCEGMTLTLPRELPPWELESRWTPECSKSDCKGQNSMDWGFFYTIENLLKFRCLKWARMTHLDIWNTSYGQKKGRESNCWESNWQFDSRSLKVRNRPDFLVCRWRVTYHWKAFDEGYNFASSFISIGGFHVDLWGPKVVGVPTLGILRLPFGTPRTKCHLDVCLVERHKVYYKGEGGDFPQVQAMMKVVSLVSSNCSWFVLAPKVIQLCTNQLVIWFCAGPCEWLSAC